MTEWLTLGEAAERLGVHPSTLRRWTDEGRVPVRRTPGGHRRYDQQEIEHYVGTEIEPSTLQPDPDSDLHYNWEDAFRAEALSELRHLGQRLLGLMIQYVSLSDEGARFLTESRAIGHRYGSESAATGMELVALVEAFIYFRTFFTNMTIKQPNFPRTGDPDEMARLYRRIDRFMNEVLLGTVEGYTEHRS